MHKIISPLAWEREYWAPERDSAFSSPTTYSAKTPFGTRYEVSFEHPASTELVVGEDHEFQNYEEMVSKYGDPESHGFFDQPFWYVRHAAGEDWGWAEEICSRVELMSAFKAAAVDFEKRVNQCYLALVDSV